MRKFAVFAACCGISLAFAQSAPLAEDDPAAWEARRARAVQLRKTAQTQRQTAVAERQREEAACRRKFLENACKDGVTERWVEKITQVRALEMEASGLEQGVRAFDLAQRKTPVQAKKPRVPIFGENRDEKPAKAPVDSVTVAPPKQARAPQKVSPKRDQQAARQMAANEAADKAAQAKQDAERYAQREREHAEKVAAAKAKAAQKKSPVAEQKTSQAIVGKP